LIRPASHRVTLFLDSAAAAALPQPGSNQPGRLEIAG
jgi:hypothetical protein